MQLRGFNLGIRELVNSFEQDSYMILVCLERWLATVQRVAGRRQVRGGGPASRGSKEDKTADVTKPRYRRNASSLLLSKLFHSRPPSILRMGEGSIGAAQGMAGNGEPPATAPPIKFPLPIASSAHQELSPPLHTAQSLCESFTWKTVVCFCIQVGSIPSSKCGS